jgi:hypothetical protein
VPAKREPLKVRVKVVSQVISNSLGAPFPEVSVGKLDDPLEERKPPDQGGDPGNEIHRAPPAMTLNEPVSPKPDATVKHLANEIRDAEIRRCCKQQAKKGTQHRQPVSPGVTEKTKGHPHGFTSSLKA